MRWVVLGLTGCMPMEGAFLGLLQETRLGEAGEQQAISLGELPLRDDIDLYPTARLQEVDAARGFRLESSDPEVIDVLLLDELDEQIDPESFDTEQLISFLNDTAEEGEPEPLSGWVTVGLRPGVPGFATLSLRDPVTGELADEVEVEVRHTARTVLAPVGARRWHTLAGLEPIGVLGGTAHFDVFAEDISGQRLAGRSDGLILPTTCEGAPPEEMARCQALPSEPGVHTVELPGGLPVTLELVEPGEIVDLQVREYVQEDGYSEALVVGVDREGRLIRGLTATWEGTSLQDRQGDLYIYAHEPSAEPVTLTVQYGELSAQVTVQQAEPGDVRLGDHTLTGCSSSGTAPVLGATMAALMALLARRRT
jgi:hypothetical protein